MARDRRGSAGSRRPGCKRWRHCAAAGADSAVDAVLVAERDRDDAVVVDQQFNRASTGKVDRDGMQPFELSLPCVQTQGGIEGIGLQRSSTLL